MRPWSFGVVILFLTGCIGSPASAPSDVSNAHVATFADIVNGAFPSGGDKQGTDGVTVVVHNVTLSEVRDENDGDWHLLAADVTYDTFIAEVIPRDQGREGRPPTDVRLALTGVPFCDNDHADAQWHGSTCWEIHPVLAWTREPST